MGARTPSINTIKDANGFDMKQVNELRMEINEFKKQMHESNAKIDKLTEIVTNLQANEVNVKVSDKKDSNNGKV